MAIKESYIKKDYETMEPLSEEHGGQTPYENIPLCTG